MRSALHFLVIVSMTLCLVSGPLQSICSAQNRPSAAGREKIEAMRAERAAKMAEVKAKTEQTKSSKKAERDAKKDDRKNGDNKQNNGDKEKKDDEESGSTITRSNEPPAESGPRRALPRPNPAGKVQLAFVGEKWPEILDWVADVSAMSLDWQELPDDYLNLTTRRSYSVPEARDLINGHLLSRGFTMLLNGETIHVVKIADMNKAMVPRVSPTDLDDRMPNEFAKVSFKLDWLVAGEAGEELKPMLSPHGSIVKLSATNRLEAFDTVSNLREIRDLLNEEQSTEGREQLVKEFRLQHRRASEVIDLLRNLFDIDPPRNSGGGGRGGDDRTAMMMKQMMDQMRRSQSGGKPGSGAAKKEEKVALVLNQRENSILAKAPPDVMAELTQAVAEIDVASTGPTLGQGVNRYQIYKLRSLNPEPLVEMLNELGDLDPMTRLNVDEAKQAIIAYASLADHYTIKTLIDRLDKPSRRFEVIQLRRLEAEYVVGTIRFLMNVEEDDNKNSRDSYYYYRYMSRSGGQQKEESKFRADADIENNRLLLNANEDELSEIENLLVKLGEIPEKGSRDAKMRLIDIDPAVNPDEFLRRLQSIWPHENPIEIEVPQVSPKARTEPARQSELPDKTVRQIPRNLDLESNRDGVMLVTDKLPELKSVPPAYDSATAWPSERSVPSTERTKPGAPVKITMTTNGQLVVTSDDPDALNTMEDMIRELASPPRRDYHVFQIKYESPGWLALTLEDFFKQEEEAKPSPYYFDYYYYSRNQGSSKKSNSLSTKKIPKFISDSRSSTILVQGADAAQLKRIEELIGIYDKPEPSDSRAVRHTEIFFIKHSRATIIAETIKDVYRDLLSANDKALQTNNEKEKTERIIYRGPTEDTGDTENPLRFKGELSVGVDDLSNTLVISARAGLLDNIRSMVETLDKAAAPASDVRVIQLDPKLDAASVQQRLNALFGGNSGKADSKRREVGKPNSEVPPQFQGGKGKGRPR